MSLVAKSNVYPTGIHAINLVTNTALARALVAKKKPPKLGLASPLVVIFNLYPESFGRFISVVLSITTFPLLLLL